VLKMMAARRAGARLGIAGAVSLALHCVLLLALVAQSHGGQTVCADAGAVRGLGLRGGRELVESERRKPLAENHQAVDLILRDWKKKAAPPTALETLLSETLFKLTSSDEFKGLKYLHIMSAHEVTMPKAGERAIVIFVPFLEMQYFRRMCPALTETLEDQLKAHVFLVSHRRVIRKERRGKALLKQKRPMSRTIKKVHEAYLEDIIWPEDVVGQRELFEVGISKPTEFIYLDPATRATTERKMEAFRAVYANLTGKKVVFEYLVYQEPSELQKQRTPNRYPCDTAGFLSYSEVKPAPLFGDAGAAPGEGTAGAAGSPGELMQA
jgi:small subunit ribosomal protein S7e